MHNSSPVEEVAALLRDPSARVRTLAARLAGKLAIACPRTGLEAMRRDRHPDFRDFLRQRGLPQRAKYCPLVH